MSEHGPSDPFSLDGRVAVITGGAGLLGREHARAISEAGGKAILVDIDEEGLRDAVAQLPGSEAFPGDITDPESVDQLAAAVFSRFRRVHVLVNNAARNPAIEPDGTIAASRLENLRLAEWNADLAVGLTGALLCSRVFGGHMAEAGGGAIVNIASDLSVISPDQRLYAQPGLADDRQPVKPLSYSVVKTGLIGMTRYLATYWAEAGVRVNALSPGGVRTDQPQAFVERLAERIPLGRMARRDEYHAAIVFLCSDASSYMTGQNLVIDGGRSVW